MVDRKRISELLEASREVIKDCVLDNGAIVAANSDKDYFPKEAKNYFYVWPRDAFYICHAAKLLGMDLYAGFFKWCQDAEGWDETGLFYEKYHFDGRKARHNLQPDQTGSVLMALHEYCSGNQKRIDEFSHLIGHSAAGLCSIWDGDHFNTVTQDLWEERFTFPDQKESFTYTLAICSKGLRLAYEMLEDDRFIKAADEMQKVLDGVKGYFTRSIGSFNDTKTDASLLGLVWPSETVAPDDLRMEETVRTIEDKIVKDHGVYRYECDEYDGWTYEGGVNRKKGAGYWPLLTFWMSIYHHKSGDEEKAKMYYMKVIDDLDKRGNRLHIPEQIFDNDVQVAVSPLCWSHAMFVVATAMLHPDNMR